MSAVISQKVDSILCDLLWKVIACLNLDCVNVGLRFFPLLGEVMWDVFSLKF